MNRMRRMIAAGLLLVVSGCSLTDSKAPVEPVVGEQRLSMQLWFSISLAIDGRLFGLNALSRYREHPPSDNIRDGVLVNDLTDWRYVYAGEEASYAIGEQGELMRFAHIHDRHAKQRPRRFVPVFGHLRWIKVETQKNTSMGLAADGRLYVWDESWLNEDTICLGQRYRGACAPLDFATGELQWESDAELRERLDAVLKTMDDDIVSRTKRETLMREPYGEVKFREWLAARRQPTLDSWQIAFKRAAERRLIRLPVALSERNDWRDFSLLDIETADLTGNRNLRGRIAYALDRSGRRWRLRSSDRQRSNNSWIEYPHDEPARIEPLPSPAKMKRLYGALMVDEQDRLWGFGSNYAQGLSQQRELPGGVPDSMPVMLPLDNWAMAMGTKRFYAGLRRDGTLWVWGAEYDWVTGRSDTKRTKAEPRRISDEDDWVEIAARGGVIQARNRRGESYAWGLNGNGQSGGQLGRGAADYCLDYDERLLLTDVRHQNVGWTCTEKRKRATRDS